MPRQQSDDFLSKKQDDFEKQIADLWSTFGKEIMAGLVKERELVMFEVDCSKLIDKAANRYRLALAESADTDNEKVAQSRKCEEDTLSQTFKMVAGFIRQFKKNPVAEAQAA